jgi:general secretion pathway protein G
MPLEVAMHWPDLKPNARNPLMNTPPNRNPASREPSRSAGFTLLEILVVVAILGLLIGLVAPAALRQLSGARNSVAKQSIERISSVLDLYKLDTGTYPTTEQGLAALVQKPAGIDNWNGPYLKGEGLPADPWNHPYVYRNPSERMGHDFDLCSLGASGNASQGNPICNP